MKRKIIKQDISVRSTTIKIGKRPSNTLSQVTPVAIIEITANGIEIITESPFEFDIDFEKWAELENEVQDDV